MKGSFPGERDSSTKNRDLFALDARAFAEELDQIVRFANLTNVFFRK